MKIEGQCSYDDEVEGSGERENQESVSEQAIAGKWLVTVGSGNRKITLR